MTQAIDQAPSLLPRRILGPDQLKFLRDVSRHQTKDRFAFDQMRVQRNSYGGPAIEIDVANLEHVGYRHPEAYGTFINNIVVPRAERIAADLRSRSAHERAVELDRLLRRGLSEDSTWFWVLSAASLRRLLFPGAYPKGRRKDNVTYLHARSDFHAGKVAVLGDLSPEGIDRFTTYATKMITSAPVDPALITPPISLAEQGYST